MTATVDIPIWPLWIDRVEIGAPDECWRWLGPHNSRSGHAYNGKQLVHRSLARLFGNDAPHQHHTCLNAWCVNPGHLEALQSQAEHTARHVQLRSTCRQGHPYDEANLHVLPNGWRRCRRCNRERMRAYTARNRAAA